MKIAINTDWFGRTGAHRFIAKELQRKGLYCEDLKEADVVWNIDSIHERGIAKGKKLTIYWEVDDFMIRGKNTNFYEQADLLYINMPEYLRYYPERTKILRMGFDPDFHRETTKKKLFDYVFVGSIEPLPVYRERIHILDRLMRSDVNMAILYGKREDFPKSLSMGKVIVDILPNDDGHPCLHQKLFEAMAVGCVIVYYYPCLDKLFTEGVHYLGMDKFKNVTDEEIEQVKKNARELLVSKHTYKHRVEQVLEDIKEYGGV